MAGESERVEPRRRTSAAERKSRRVFNETTTALLVACWFAQTIAQRYEMQEYSVAR